MKGLGAVQIIASFIVSGINLISLPQVQTLFTVLSAFPDNKGLHTQLTNKWEFCKEIYEVFFNSELLICGGSTEHWPFYGWSQ